MHQEGMTVTMRLGVCLALVALASSASGGPLGDKGGILGPRSGVVLDPSRGGSAQKSVECTIKVDGVCTQEKCTGDKESDCQTFVNDCIDGGHRFEGTKGGGYCTKKTE